jgi:polysaccharide export outer membrane protein
MEAATIRQRLEEGDLRVGDRVLLLVEGHTQLSDTFNVVAGRKLVLPDIGDVPLAGVLRSELQEHLTAQLGRFVRNPTVRVRSLIRLEVLGLVAAPGFYAIPSDVLVTDALMLAGGPAPDADIDRVRLQRGREVLWEGDRLRAAVIEGRTLDQLGVRAGDGIFVPEKRPRFAGFRDVLVVVSGVASLVYVANRIGWL